MDERDEQQPEFFADDPQPEAVEEVWETEEEYIEDPSQKTLLIWIGGALFLLVIVGFFVFGRGGSSGGAVDLSGLEKRLDQMEVRLNDLEKKIDAQSGRLEAIETQEKNLTDHSRILAQKVDALGEMMVSVSKKLKVPTREYSATPRLSTPAKPAETATEAAKPETPTPPYHVVKKGETLYRISQVYKISVGELQKINGLKSSNIYPGQKLYLKR